MTERQPQHQLVKSGPYRWLRHPSYTGWFYWSVGTQMLLGNPLCVFAYAATASAFFRSRVRFEETSLIGFYGADYVNFLRSRYILIPFVWGVPLPSPSASSESPISTSGQKSELGKES
jgi:protein-S-isoprenylcysteine O-methyltransferase